MSDASSPSSPDADETSIRKDRAGRDPREAFPQLADGPDDKYSLKDLGEASIYLCLMLVGIVLITPIGGLAPLAVVLGVAMLALGIQLVLRKPYLLLPEPIGGAVTRQNFMQSAIVWLLGAGERFARYQNDPPHWLTMPPFDLFPRLLIVAAGILVVVTAGVPYMAAAIGLSVILICMSLMLFSLSVFIAGAALLAWSTIIPLLLPSV